MRRGRVVRVAAAVPDAALGAAVHVLRAAVVDARAGRAARGREVPVAAPRGALARQAGQDPPRAGQPCVDACRPEPRVVTYTPNDCNA